MKYEIYLLALFGCILSIVLLLGCVSTQPNVTTQTIEKEIICNKPYIRVGAECCLDQNDNKICDKDEAKKVMTCQDGTPYNQCSYNKPKYCYNGTLIDAASLCGCPAGYIIAGNSCVEEKYAVEVKENQSRMYWSTTYPLAIMDYKGTSSGLILLIQNRGDSKVIIRMIAAGGNSTTITGSYELLPGESKQYTATNTVCSTAGSTFEFSNVSITYDIVDGISGNVLVGDRPLVGKCAS
jgi:hypothetical protein